MSDGTTQDALVVCKGVTKKYKSQFALDHLDLEVRSGEVLGLLGPNGAGKTTLIKILIGLAMPTSGEISILGHDLFANRKKAVQQLGAVVEAPIFFDYLTGRANLKSLADLSGGATEKQMDDVLDIVGLSSEADKKVGAYSYGMKQRLGIAQALLPDNRFLILDEPTNGLDPHGIAGIRQLIRRLQRDLGITILLCSHMLVEVEQVCDRVVIIDHGKKVLEGDVASLNLGQQGVLLRVRQSDDAEAFLRELGGEDVSIITQNESLEIILDLDEPDVPGLVRQCTEKEIDVLEIGVRRKTLEEIFMEHTEERS